MIKKKLLIIIGILLILNVYLVGCSKSYQTNKSIENTIVTTDTSENYNKNKETDEKYIEIIKPYIANIRRDWKYISRLCSNNTNISENTKEEIANAFTDVNKNWEKIFKVESDTTINIKEIKKIMENIKNLPEKSINDFTSSLNKLDKEKMKQYNELLNESNEIMKNEFVPLFHKMNNEKES